MNNKNYYDELEINKNASKEVIKKVYKLLAKKYHPDTCEDQDKKRAEEKFKKITEAYETLIDDDKRKDYDSELLQNEISEDSYNSLLNENIALKSQLELLRNELNNLKYQSYSNNFQDDNSSKLDNEYYSNTRYYNPTYNNLYKSNSSKQKVSKKQRLKNFKDTFIAIILTIIIISSLIYVIPYLAYIENLIFSTSYIENFFSY